MKRTISLLLSLLMVFSLFAAVPITALTATAVVTDVAATGITTVGVTTPYDLRVYLEQDVSYPLVIRLDADIENVVGKSGDSSDASYTRYWATVRGSKKLDLNGHSVTMLNYYSVIHDHYGESNTVIAEKNIQTLFNIPSGSELTVDGEGTVRYNGVLLNKCDAVDQRDIFEVNGGSLIVNNGSYVIDDKSVSFTNKLGYKNWLQLNGTALTVNSGNVTVNGGSFQGRGLRNYTVGSNGSNGAIEVSNNFKGKVVINDGHFYGISHGNAARIYGKLISSGRVVINAGLFELDQLDSDITTTYGDVSHILGEPGYMGLEIPTLRPQTSYAYGSDGDHYTEITQQMVDDFIAARYDGASFTAYLQNSRYLRIRPQANETAHDMSFIAGGEVYGSSDSSAPLWDTECDCKVVFNPKSLYFPSVDSASVDQAMKFTTLTVTEKGGSTALIDSRDIQSALELNSDGTYVFNLYELPVSFRAQLEIGKTYSFKFRTIETWENTNRWSAVHNAVLNVTTGSIIYNMSASIAAPSRGAKPDYKPVSADPDAYSVEFSSWYNVTERKDIYVYGDYRFQTNRTYRLTLIFKPGDYIYCEDIPAIRVNGKNASVVKWGGSYKATVDYTLTDGPITKMEFTCHEPAAEEYPWSSAQESEAAYGYMVYETNSDWVIWYSADGNEFDGAFVGGEVYTICIPISATGGSTISDGVQVTVNGMPARFERSGSSNWGHVYCSFVCPEPEPLKVIELVDVYIDLPYVGEYPSFDPVISTEHVSLYPQTHYSDFYNGVKWYSWYNMPVAGNMAPDTNTFVNDNQYDFSVSIVPDEGYTLSETETVIRINGKAEGSVTVHDNSKHTAIINSPIYRCGDAPAEDTEINYVNISVDVPIAGGNPVFTAEIPGDRGCYLDVEDSFYTGGVRWKKGSTVLRDTDVFEADTTYNLGLKLKAHPGFTFNYYNSQIYINGYEAQLEPWGSETGDTVYVSFDISSKKFIDRVDLTLDVPEPGNAPSYTFEVPDGVHYGIYDYDNDQFGILNGIRWFNYTDGGDHIDPDSDYVFESGKLYKVNIDVIPDEGYILTLDTGFYINGKESSILAVNNYNYSISGSTTYLCQNVEKYDLWLGDTQVTSLNRYDILGDGCASYDPDSSTLTLDEPQISGATFSDYGFAIISAENMDLTVKGAYYMTEPAENCCIVVNGGKLTLAGDFTLMSDSSAAVLATEELILESGTIYASSEHNAALFIYDGVMKFGNGLTKVEAISHGTDSDTYSTPIVYDEINFGDALAITTPEGGIIGGSWILDAEYKKVQRVVIEPKDLETVDKVEITLDTPVAGAHPDYNPEYSTGKGYRILNESAGGYIDGTHWYRYAEGYPNLEPDNDTFEAGGTYACRVVLVTEDGYKFDSDIRDNITINGIPAYLTSVLTDNWFIAEVTFTVPSEDTEPKYTMIDSVAANIELPEAGKKAAYTAELIGAEGYHIDAEYVGEGSKNGVEWWKYNGAFEALGDGAFEGGCTYLAKVRLAAEEGYRFDVYNLAGTLNGEEAYTGAYDVDGEWIEIYAYCYCEETEKRLLGDSDGDGDVTIIDATYIQRDLAGLDNKTGFVEAAADTDADGDLTIVDATFIQRWLVGLPSNENIGKPI